MQRMEAAWLAARLRELPAETLFPMLNVGSSTGHFRSVRQPWIEMVVFAPIRHRGHRVCHMDMKAASGVDLTGNLMDPGIVKRLASEGFRSILCSNVLEHLVDRTAFSRQLQDLLPSGGHLIVTVPRCYPYHPDPIDTGFRPTVAELTALFPELQMVAAENVDCGTFFDTLAYGWPEAVARIAWVFLPFVRWRGWIANLQRLLWVGRQFSATCAVFQRPARTAMPAPQPAAPRTASPNLSPPSGA